MNFLLYIEKFFQVFFNLFNEMAIYLLFGFTVAGILRVVISDTFIAKYLGEKTFLSNLISALFGVPLPLCSCGVIPTGVSLYHQGASKGSVIAFLTSTPQTGIDSLIVTYGVLGLPLALFKFISAFITGLVGGTIYNLFSRKETIQELNINTHLKQLHTFSDFFHYSFIKLVRSLRNGLLLGLLIASFISMLIPHNFVNILDLNHYSWLLYLIVLLVAIPMYVCSTASIPIAAIFLMKGWPIGAAIIFLMAGPATNIATITVLWEKLGKKATLIYLVNIVIGSCFFAVLFDQFAAGMFLNLKSPTLYQHNNFNWWHLTGSAILAILLIYSYKKRKKIVHN